MTACRRWLLIFCALILGGGGAMAASTREQRAYAAAAAAFQTEMWGRAETGFAQFVQQYPKSTNAPMALLLQAQAQFKQGKFADAITLLAEHKGRAGALADQYVSWIGEAQFAGSNYVAAAGTFTSLMNDYPDSPLRLRAAIEAAAAYDRAEEWQQVVSFLAPTNRAFQQKMDLDPDNELVSSGRLLVARAWSRLGEPKKSLAALSVMNAKSLNLKQDGQLNQITYDDALAGNDIPAALLAATNLVQLARLEKDNSLGADAWTRMASLLTASGQPAAAMVAWQQNLAPGTPDDKQREAILKIAELASGLNQFADAEQWLEGFLRQFPDSPQADIALLTSGELLLKEYAAASATNNYLAAAQAQFDQLVSKFPDSPLAGKALLDRGWCQWLAGKTADSLADFEAAAQKPLSREDLAVAKFKAGDVLFAQTNYEGALEHYRSVFPNALSESSPGQPAEQELAGKALYQSLRAYLELGDAVGASEAFGKIFQMFAGGELGQASALLYGESLVKPAEARALYEKLAPKFSGSPLEPELRLAIARTYEQEQDWPAAVTNYEGWVRDFPTNGLRPQADYELAAANFQAGDETAALAQFTRFVAEHPTDTNAPTAQWWVAEYFFRAGEYVGAETNYEAIFQNTNAVWKNSALIYPAQLMAGRAAMGRQDFSDAVKYYFLPLISDTTNCPADSPVGVKARFAYGTALMNLNQGDTNATFTYIMTATNLFSQIVQSNPTNELGARAWGEIGNCALQLGDYATATNAYAQVFSTNSPADLSARSGAQVGFGIVLEKMAAQPGEADQTNLLGLALDNYLRVFYGENMRDGEQADAYWTKEAGWRAAPLIGQMEQYETATNFYGHLRLQFPQLAEQIDKKVSALAPQKN